MESTEPSVPEIIDARELPRGTCRDTILDAVFTLAAGATVVIVNDHDIQPLKMLLSVSRPGQFEFVYLEDGPEVWRILIHRKG